MNKRDVLILVVAAFAAGVFISKKYYENKKTPQEKLVEMITATEPTQMQMPEPKPEKDIAGLNVKPAATMTFVLAPNDRLYYYKGNFANILTPASYQSVRGLIKNFMQKTKANDLMFVIKTDKKASFKNTIDILDEMTINNVPDGHYAEADLTEAEKIYLKSVIVK